MLSSLQILFLSTTTRFHLPGTKTSTQTFVLLLMLRPLIPSPSPLYALTSLLSSTRPLPLSCCIYLLPLRWSCCIFKGQQHPKNHIKNILKCYPHDTHLLSSCRQQWITPFFILSLLFLSTSCQCARWPVCSPHLASQASLLTYSSIQIPSCAELPQRPCAGLSTINHLCFPCLKPNTFMKNFLIRTRELKFSSFL